jgi:hypothetical protein
VLEHQLKEKKDMKDVEFAKNKEYVAMVIARDEADRADQKDKQRKNFEKMKELQRF